MITAIFAFLICIIFICESGHSAALTSQHLQHQKVQKSLVSEGSLCDMRISPSMANKPGSAPGFYNPKRQIGRDFVVLSVANWLYNDAKRRAAKCEGSKGSDTIMPRPARVLDAACATGIQGLRTFVESPILAEAMLKTKKNQSQNSKMLELAELQLVLNDMDANAIEIANENANSVLRNSGLNLNCTIKVTQRVAQATMHEETFEVSILDPFGSVQPFLDAALSRAPKGGLIEVCATDVGVLYGTRPSIAARHYHAHLAQKRPPCYRERGVRLLYAAIAQAAGRHDRGVEPVYGISTEHFCLASMRVLRGAKAADFTVEHLKAVKICRSCGAASKGACTEVDTIEPPSCECKPIDGAGTDAKTEGPLWVGPLYDLDTVNSMVEIAGLEEAKGLMSKETLVLLQKLKEEAAIKNMFHRRPGVAAKGKTPKLTEVMGELQRRGFRTARTHFCAKSLKTEASTQEFDAAVKALL
eukprot:110242_1